MAAGGAPANVAVALARLGTASGFLGKVGNDFFGLHLKAVLEESGVDTSYMQLDKSTNTGLAFVSWDERGDASYLFYRNPSADTMLKPSEISRDYIQQARVLQFGSLLLANEPASAATYHALRLAGDAGVFLSYDLNLRLFAWPDEETARSVVSVPLAFAHILKINQHELEWLTGLSDPLAGTDLLWTSNLALIVVTLGGEGCFYRTADFNGRVGSFPVEVKDTIGAGDGFMAGLLDGLRRGNFDFDDEAMIRQACRQATAVGAISTTRPGGIPSFPNRAEVDQLLATINREV
jgi:fructokinase